MSKPVLVTGASTGIGRAIVERLAAAGLPVYATARKPDDLAGLDAIPDVMALPLDVRDPASVVALAETIRTAGRGLYAVVNNAGLGGIGPVASFTDEAVRDLFEVNVFGVFRLTRACLPLILESHGRVIVIGSQGGSVSMRWYAPYTMTKHAMEAFTKALDDEIRPHGARALIVQPGAVSTAIGDNSETGDRERFRSAPPPFDVDAAAILKGFDEPSVFDPTQPESAGNRRHSPPDDVARVVESLLTDPDPPLRSLVGTRWEGNRVITTLIDRLVEANACPSLGYSADELAAKVRERMARGRP
ncbi:MAG TPA: SDR family oxidoreductase [Candidatus Eisenbacteria bacterium]